MSASLLVLASNGESNHVLAWGKDTVERLNAASPPGGPLTPRKEWQSMTRSAYGETLAELSTLPVGVTVTLIWSNTEGAAFAIVGIDAEKISSAVNTTIAKHEAANVIKIMSLEVPAEKIAGGRNS